MLELCQQPPWIGEQIGNVLPDDGLDLLGPHLPARASRRSGGDGAILAAAFIVAPLWLPCGCPVGVAEHSPAADLAGQQAAQQIVVFLVVSK
jgi:hypothetical protein